MSYIYLFICHDPEGGSERSRDIMYRAKTLEEIYSKIDSIRKYITTSEDDTIIDLETAKKWFEEFGTSTENGIDIIYPAENDWFHIEIFRIKID